MSEREQSALRLSSASARLGFLDKWWQGAAYPRMPKPEGSQTLVDSAFERVADLFSPEWCDDPRPHPAWFYLVARGTLSFSFLLDLGLDLLAVDACLRTPTLWKDLRNGECFSSTRLELGIAADLRRCGQYIEFRPPLPSGRKSDLLAQHAEQSVFIEIKHLSPSDSQLSLNRLSIMLISGLSDAQRTAPWLGFPEAHYDVEISDRTLGLLGAGPEVDEATTVGIIKAILADVNDHFKEAHPPFDFDVSGFARVRIGADAKSTVGGPAFS